MHNDGHYGPWDSETLNVVFPGFVGGANWGEMSFNPLLGYLFVNVNNLGAMARLKDGAIVPEAFVDPVSGLPCQNGPWGEFLAINVNQAEIVWRTPIGLNLGGSVATAGGLVFLAATNDRRFRAFEARTGRELWSAPLEASGHATPVTYLGNNGRQYVAIAAGGGTAIGDRRISDVVAAFAVEP